MGLRYEDGQAVVQIVSVELSCPRCGEGLACPSNGGSYIWPTDAYVPHGIEKCAFCGALLRLPDTFDIDWD